MNNAFLRVDVKMKFYCPQHCIHISIAYSVQIQPMGDALKQHHVKGYTVEIYNINIFCNKPAQ